eukprot:c41647_g1_i1 orf=360-794(+)
MGAAPEGRVNDEANPARLDASYVMKYVARVVNDHQGNQQQVTRRSLTSHTKRINNVVSSQKELNLDSHMHITSWCDISNHQNNDLFVNKGDKIHDCHYVEQQHACTMIEDALGNDHLINSPRKPALLISVRASSPCHVPASCRR